MPSIQPDFRYSSSGVEAGTSTVSKRMARPSDAGRTLHGLRASRQRKSFGRREGEAEPRVEEAPAPHRALRRIVAKGDAVDRREIAAAIVLAYARRVELARRLQRHLHALRGRRMGREHVGPAGARRRAPRPHGGVAGERTQETRSAIGVVARLGHGPHADRVGGEFLLAREARERQLGLLLQLLAAGGIVQHLRGDLAEQRRALLQFNPLHGMAGRHMRHLMRQHRGNLRGGVDEGQQPARDVEVPVGKRESVDGRRVQDRDLIADPGLGGSGDEACRDRIEQGLGLGIAIGAAESGDQAALFPAAVALRADRAGRRLRHGARRGVERRGRLGRAAPQQGQEGARGRGPPDRKPAAPVSPRIRSRPNHR